MGIEMLQKEPFKDHAIHPWVFARRSISEHWRRDFVIAGGGLVLSSVTTYLLHLPSNDAIELLLEPLIVGILTGLACLVLILVYYRTVVSSKIYKDLVDDHEKLQAKLDSLKGDNLKPDMTLIEVAKHLKANTEFAHKGSIETEISSAAFERPLKIWARKRIVAGTIYGGIGERLYLLDSEIFADHQFCLPDGSYLMDDPDSDQGKFEDIFAEMSPELGCKDGEIRPGIYCAPMFSRAQVEMLWPPKRQDSHNTGSQS